MSQTSTVKSGREADNPIGTLICEWEGCPIVARFHIEVPLNHVSQLSSGGELRMPFSHTHHNVCAAHLDEYSMMRPPKAIYGLGKCPHCLTAA
jgi:hypothetical protein